ncbi:MAG: Uma2 family endonuclease [Planctomycetota bacterium]|nr:Uma2 family endonuclease [Planctomycetota bacterium]
MSTAIATTWDQRLDDLGHVPAYRIISDPAPGTATWQDVVRILESQHRICELVDGTMVEKTMGWQESLLAGVLVQWLRNYLDTSRLGVVTGADGLTRLFGDTVRSPDVAFVAWDRLPDRRIPSEPIPELVPNFVIEVLSTGNTYSEMSRKRREYFHAGVQLLWMVDPRDRTVAVYRSSTDVTVVREGGTLTGDAILPGWTINTGDLFAKLDEQGG